MADINDKYKVEVNLEAEDIIKQDELTKTEDDFSFGESVKKYDGLNDYVQDLRGLIEAEVQNNFDEEIKKAKQELITEHRKAITQITEEQKSIIRELVKEEKKAIWGKAAEFKQSLLLHLSEEFKNNNT